MIPISGHNQNTLPEEPEFNINNTIEGANPSANRIPVCGFPLPFYISVVFTSTPNIRKIKPARCHSMPVYYVAICVTSVYEHPKYGTRLWLQNFARLLLQYLVRLGLIARDAWDTPWNEGSLRGGQMNMSNLKEKGQ